MVFQICDQFGGGFSDLHPIWKHGICGSSDLQNKPELMAMAGGDVDSAYVALSLVVYLLDVREGLERVWGLTPSTVIQCNQISVASTFLSHTTVLLTFAAVSSRSPSFPLVPVSFPLRIACSSLLSANSFIFFSSLVGLHVLPSFSHMIAGLPPIGVSGIPSSFSQMPVISSLPSANIPPITMTAPIFAYFGPHLVVYTIVAPLSTLIFSTPISDHVWATFSSTSTMADTIVGSSHVSTGTVSCTITIDMLRSESY
ncbi:hypothetical protein L1987_49115 [Smallanthus sonchifolius]|uniref:Uncharacterized protein n=1 Tax=Smallanthus sonchifolius TaxID=185202 RepID=A0ACB9FTL7_9ASTR|nr:hypothetical protein L1987_49115 [Smallanthus sonchifolius]